MNMVPTLVNYQAIGREEGVGMMLVYMTRTADDGQGLYFYSLDEQCTFACLKNAELFVHCYDNQN